MASRRLVLNCWSTFNCGNWMSDFVKKTMRTMMVASVNDPPPLATLECILRFIGGCSTWRRVCTFPKPFNVIYWRHHPGTEISRSVSLWTMWVTTLYDLCELVETYLVVLPWIKPSHNCRTPPSSEDIWWKLLVDRSTTEIGLAIFLGSAADSSVWSPSFREPFRVPRCRKVWHRSRLNGR